MTTNKKLTMINAKNTKSKCSLIRIMWLAVHNARCDMEHSAPDVSYIESALSKDASKRKNRLTKILFYFYITLEFPHAIWVVDRNHIARMIITYVLIAFVLIITILIGIQIKSGIASLFASLFSLF